MQRVAPVNTFFSRSSRRAYAAVVEAEGTRSSAASSGAVAPGMMRVGKAAAEAEAESGAGSPGEKAAEIFWMREPKTGNWIPENRFGEVDVAELRRLRLSKK